MNKVYLGDSVYCDFDGFGIALTTENGLPNDPSNLIYIEPEVYINLLNYVNNLKGYIKQNKVEEDEA